MTDTRISGNLASGDAWRKGLARLSDESGSDAMRELFEQRSDELRRDFAGATGETARISKDALPSDAVDGIKSVDSELKDASRITEDLLTGQIDSPHEVAARIRRADLTLKFSMEIRNRLVEAYREVMRMSV